ncbi:hypothetical protein GC173_02590 [bacterium]|nr:hypothetical protein [bacterium]
MTAKSTSGAHAPDQFLLAGERMTLPTFRSIRPLTLLSALLASAASAQTVTTLTDLVTATDALGRTMPDASTVPEPRADRVVGIFYFLWMGEHGEFYHTDPGRPEPATPAGEEPPPAPYDITRILAANPTNPAWGPLHAFHFWGEPQFGYYLSSDEFVMARHVQMLGDIGVDVLFLDVSNGYSYPNNYLKLCTILESLRDAGRPVPKITFLAYNNAPVSVQAVWRDFYSKGLHRDCWFLWEGKPLILTPPASIPPEAADFFTVRESWAWSDPNQWFGNGHEKWPWLDNTPQAFGWDTDPTQPTAMPVAAAGHPVTNVGRSHHGGAQPAGADLHSEQGLYFDEQWQQALKRDPRLVFVTGWNEWVAMRFESDGNMHMGGKRVPKGGSFFVDQYTQEFSRDIEPMRGGHGDNYYYQLAANIRRFKGIERAQPTSAPVTITIDGDPAEWVAVTPRYLDDPTDTQHRDHRGWGREGVYRNSTGRNNIVSAQVARDDRSVYFLVETRDPLTPREGDQWMRLYIDLDRDHTTGWNGYDYLVNRTATPDDTASVERYQDGQWVPTGHASIAQSSNAIELAIPRELLGDKAPVRMNFKWTDNMHDSNDIADWLQYGDAAPLGRFSYRYGEQGDE